MTNYEIYKYKKHGGNLKQLLACELGNYYLKYGSTGLKQKEIKIKAKFIAVLKQYGLELPRFLK